MINLTNINRPYKSLTKAVRSFEGLMLHPMRPKRLYPIVVLPALFALLSLASAQENQGNKLAHPY